MLLDFNWNWLVEPKGGVSWELRNPLSKIVTATPQPPFKGRFHCLYWQKLASNNILLYFLLKSNFNWLLVNISNWPVRTCYTITDSYLLTWWKTLKRTFRVVSGLSKNEQLPQQLIPFDLPIKSHPATCAKCESTRPCEESLEKSFPNWYFLLQQAFLPLFPNQLTHKLIIFIELKVFEKKKINRKTNEYLTEKITVDY